MKWTRFELHGPWRLLFPSPIPPTQKKNHCLLPESDTADPLVPKTPRNRHRRRPPSSEPCEITVENAHKALLPPSDEVEHDAPIAYRLISVYPYDTCPVLTTSCPAPFKFAQEPCFFFFHWGGMGRCLILWWITSVHPLGHLSHRSLCSCHTHEVCRYSRGRYCVWWNSRFRDEIVLPVQPKTRDIIHIF